MSIDYTEYGRLKVTPLGDDVLYGRTGVSLTKPVEYKEKKKGESFQKETPRQAFRRELLVRISLWRKQRADQEGVSPTHLLSDATLTAMAEVPTLFPAQLESITGFSAHKRQRYGTDILQEIRAYCNGQQWVKSIKGATYLETLDYLHAGISLEEISQTRGLGMETLYGHLAWLIDQGEDLDIDPFLSPEHQSAILTRWHELGRPESLNTVIQKLPAGIGFGQIKVALANWHRQQKADPIPN
jgi:ATP-dependent DNA helicase RecQ